MPRVMTWDELEEQKVPPVQSKEQKVRDMFPSPAPNVYPGERYLLTHPELEDDFEDTMNLDGVEYKRKCERGVLRVESLKVKDYLVSKGFIFLRSEKNE